MTLIGIAAATLLLIVYLILAARRKGDVANASLVAIAAAYAGVAVASFLGVRGFAAVLDEVARSGRAFPEVTRGIWEAALLPMSAAGAAVIVTAVALLLMLREERGGDARSSRSLWIAAVAIACGSAAVLLLRDATRFTFETVIRGAANAPDAIAARLFNVSAASAVCFVLAVTVAAVLLRTRTRATFRAAVVALAIALALSAALAAGLRSYANDYRALYLDGPAAMARR